MSGWTLADVDLLRATENFPYNSIRIRERTEEEIDAIIERKKQAAILKTIWSSSETLPKPQIEYKMEPHVPGGGLPTRKTPESTWLTSEVISY